MNSKNGRNNESYAFDYTRLRFVMGVVALLLPVSVAFFAQKPLGSEGLDSISASYYAMSELYGTTSRNVFVGMMFVTATLLLAYRGLNITHGKLSRLAATASVVVALFPVNHSCYPVKFIHYTGAATLFLILIIFCFSLFQKDYGKEGDKKKRRKVIYWICGTIMSLGLVSLAIVGYFYPDKKLSGYGLFFWIETVMLMAYGIAFVVSGKAFKIIASDNEWNPFFSPKKNQP